MSWGETLDQQKSALRWDIKRSLNSLCRKLSEIGEECFVVTVNISNGWVGHMGSVRGNEYIDQKSFIPYDFLDYCRALDESGMSFADEKNDSGDDASDEDDKDTEKEEEEDRTAEDSGDNNDSQDNANHNDRVTIARYEPDSPTEDRSHRIPSPSTYTKEDGRHKLLKMKSKKIIQHARQHLIKTYSKNQKFLQQNDSDSNDSVKTQSSLGAKITKNGKFGLYCTPCELNFSNRTVFMDHIKCRPHLLKSQRLLLCFKCFQAFESSQDMYAHMRNCDMLTSVLNLIKTNYDTDDANLRFKLATENILRKRTVETEQSLFNLN